MKQLIVTGPRQAAFEDVPTPSCPAGGLLVRATHTAVSTGTEIRVYRAIPVDDAGQFLHERVPMQFPATNGYSMVGEVIEVGPKTERFSVGDRVFAQAPHAQVAALSADCAVTLPEGIPDEEAVFLNIMEVGHIALRRGHPTPGENVAVIGQGVIGLSTLAYARAFGFRTVAIDRVPARLEIAEQMGADLTVNASDEHCVERVIEFFDGRGADLIVECASVWPAVETGMQIAAPEATLVVAARHTDTPAFNPVGHPHLGKKLTLLTSYGHPPDGQRWDRRRSFALTVDLMARRKLTIAPMVTHRLDWHQLPEVYRRLDQGETDMVGVVLRWESIGRVSNKKNGEQPA